MIGLVGAGRVGFVKMDTVVVNATDEQGGTEGREPLYWVKDCLKSQIFLMSANGDRCSVGDAVDLCFNALGHQLAGIGHRRTLQCRRDRRS